MPMKKLFAIIFACSLLFAACSDEEDVLPTQRTSIESYLKTKHKPGLVPEAELEPGSDVSNYYTTSGNTVYRYIPGINDPDRENRPEVTRSSTVTVIFRIYDFSSYADIPASRLPDFSNDPDLKAEYERAGLNTEMWSFEPLAINMAHDGILKGLYRALLGCREGDRVEAYMTYNMAYGDAYFSVIPKECPLYIDFTVESVE